MKSPTVRQATAAEALARVEPPKLLGKLTHVSDVLIQPGWDDGVAKGERAVLCFVSSTLVRLIIKVECPGVKLNVTGRSWDEAWAALEAVLRSEDIPWEADAPREKGTGRKRK